VENHFIPIVLYYSRAILALLNFEACTLYRAPSLRETNCVSYNCKFNVVEDLCIDLFLFTYEREKNI